MTDRALPTTAELAAFRRRILGGIRFGDSYGDPPTWAAQMRVDCLWGATPTERSFGIGLQTRMLVDARGDRRPTSAQLADMRGYWHAHPDEPTRDPERARGLPPCGCTIRARSIPRSARDRLPGRRQLPSVATDPGHGPMSAPSFGDLDALARPTFGQPAGRVTHHCVASWGFACPGPGPHDPPDKADPATVPAFPELEPTPSLWSSQPAPLDVPEHYDPRPEPTPAPGDIEPDELATDHETMTGPDPHEPEPAQDRPGATERPDPCATRYADTQEGPLTACTLPAGHSGRHETHTRREAAALAALMAAEPEHLCRCGHIAGAHDLTDGEPGPCWHRASGLHADGDGFECWCDTFEPER